MVKLGFKKQLGLKVGELLQIQKDFGHLAYEMFWALCCTTTRLSYNLIQVIAWISGVKRIQATAWVSQLLVSPVPSLYYCFNGQKRRYN